MALSVGQVAANSVAAWLQASLSPDVTVSARWPGTTQLPVNSANRVKAVTVTKVGRRTRLDAELPLVPLAQTMLTTTTASATFPIGAYAQPLQIDIWCAYDSDREDILDQLDDVLNQGVDKTIDPTRADDPVRDGIVLPIPEENGYVGYLDCWFDEPEIVDDPVSVQAAEYRASISGVVRGTFARIREVPTLHVVTAAIKSSEASPAPAGQPYETVTLTATPDGIVVTHGTSA
jgi:hypothetical protein